VIYDKRRAVIEYVVFYTTPSKSVGENNVQDDQLDVTKLQHQLHSQALLGDEDHCRTETPSSGSSSPQSGRFSPASSDDGIADVVPVAYEPVQSVNVVRQRTKPVPPQPGFCNSQGISDELCWK